MTQKYLDEMLQIKLAGLNIKGVTMKRIYISGAISGTPDAEQRFGDAEEYLHIVYPEAETINPQRIGGEAAYTAPSLTHKEYMKLAKTALDMCDAIFMIPGWQHSKGAMWENGYAVGCGKEVILMDESWYQETEQPSHENISRTEKQVEACKKAIRAAWAHAVRKGEVCRK